MLSRHEPKHILPKRLEFTGIAASDGYALGLLWFAETELASGYTPKQNAAEETHALTAAIETAKHEVLELLAGAKNQAAEILEFQIAVFDDETFQNTAFTEISNGKTAYDSWSTLLNAEIENYQRSNDETFRARALDFQDISARVTRILCSQPSQKIPANVIVFASNLTPTAFIGHDWQGGGIALTGGSTTSHVAILARQFGVPMVTNIVLENEPKATHALHNGARVLLSSHLKIGKLIVAPNIKDEQEAKQQHHAIVQTCNSTDSGRLVTQDGTPISLMINLARLSELDHINPDAIDGIGLVRTEFLFANITSDEETQFQAYCHILNWAKSKPVYVRTIDAGGDKPSHQYSNIRQFSNLRGIRLSLSQPDIFRVQIRAILRAAVFGQLHVTLPMVASESDFDAAAALFEDEARKLADAKVAFVMPPIGIMVEVPAVASTLERFSGAAHFSIGTNDLIQYSLAQPRDVGGEKSGVDQPKIMSIMKGVVAAGRLLNKPVSVCGDAASDAVAAIHLLSAGIVNFSVTPQSNTVIRAAIGSFHAKEPL